MPDSHAATISIDDAIGHRVVGDARISPDGAWVVFSLGWAAMAEEHPTADLWLAATDGSSVRRLTSGASNDIQPRWSPDGSAIAFISDRESRGAAFDPERGATGALFLISPSGGEAVRISKTEMGLSDPQWAPDGAAIAVKGTDPETEEDKRRKKERDDTVVHGENDKYDRLYTVAVPADPFGQARIDGAEPRRVFEGQWQVWEHQWSPDGSHIAVTLARRPGFDDWFSGIRVALVPAAGGEPTFVAGESGTYRSASSLAWSPSGKRLAFLGGFDLERDAGEAIYLVDPADPSTATLRFNDEDGSPLSVGWLDDNTLLMERLLSVHATLWRLGVAGGAPETVLPAPLSERGTTSGSFAYNARGLFDRSGTRFAVIWGDATRPHEVWAGEVGGQARQLTHFGDELAARRLGRQEVVRWTAADGLEIEGQLIYPVDYEPGKRYPTIVHIHGGPSWAWDDHLYANWHDWGQFLAGHGYLVFMPNPRGSTGRGWRYQIANLFDWMGNDFTDSQAGVDMLVERGLADPDRLGIGGWSYGGFTTAWTVTQTSRYKAAIVGAGVTNRTSMQNTSDIPLWAESWFRADFAESPDEFWYRSPMRYIGQTTTPTLVLHGERDLRVPVSQGWEMYNQLRRMGVPTKMVVYPREPHGIGERHHQRDVLERVLEWFDRYVRG